MGPQKAGGIRGWLGEMEQNPILGQIRSLIGTPTTATETTPAALPSRAISGRINEPPAPTLAQSATETTTPGAAPPRPTAPDVTLQTGPLSHPQPTTRTVSVPRHVFQSPEEAMYAQTAAKETGEIQGVIRAYESAGVPHDQAVQNALEERRRARGVGASGFQSIFGEAQDDEGNWYPTTVTFNRASGLYEDLDGNPVRNFRRSTTTGARGINDREAFAREMFGGKAYVDLTPEQQAAVNQRLVSFTGEKAGATVSGRGQAAATVPLSTEQRAQHTNALATQWAAYQAPIREMQRQNLLIKTALQRYDADPVGSSQAIISTFNKVLDPQSVVRTSEYARTGQDLGLLDRLQGLYNKYSVGGAPVPKEILAGMVDTADALVNGMTGWNADQRTRLTATATSFGLDPALIFGEGTAPAPASPGGPSPQVGAPPPGTGPGSDWTMVNGRLYYKGKPY